MLFKNCNIILCLSYRCQDVCNLISFLKDYYFPAFNPHACRDKGVKNQLKAQTSEMVNYHIIRGLY